MKNRFHRLKEIFNSKANYKRKYKKIFWGSIAGCAGLAVILAGGFFLKAKGASKDQTETTVQSAEAKTGTISTTVEGIGSISNGAATDVVVPTGIKVKEVLVESGDTVEEGQVLATLDEASIASELLEVKENIESVEAEIDDLSSDAETAGTTEYLEAKVLNGELEELQEAETTLTSLLETQTITATCAGTVSSINVEADTEITKSSGSTGNSSSGNSNSGSSTGNSASAGMTGVSTGAAADSTSSSSSESTSGSDSTSSSGETNTSVTGSYSLMFLTAQTGSSSSSVTTTASDKTATQTAQSSGSGTAVQTTEVSTTDAAEKITTVDLDVTAPKTGAKPQDTIKETDQYTGTISWNCSSDTFEAGTSYTADIRLTAKDGYVFSAKILPEIKGADVTFEVTENDAGQSVLRIKAKFSKTGSKTENNGNSNNNGNNNNANDNNNSSNSGNNSGSNASSGGSGNTSGTTGNTSGVSENASGTTGNTSGGSASGSSGSVAGSSGGTSADTAGDTSDSGSSVTSQYSAYETAAFSIASNDQATVSINVDELDITSVKTGQTAKITLDAIEGEEFEGTITSVSSESSSGSSSAKYPVEITFDKTDDMRIGMTASASISIDEAEDAVLIPVDALQEKGGKTFVYTKKDSDGNLSGEVEVETGLSNGNKVEITSGLESGDTVYYLKTTSSGSSDANQDMQGGPGGQGGEAPSDMGGQGGPGGDSSGAPSDMGGNGGPGGQGGNSSN